MDTRLSNNRYKVSIIHPDSENIHDEFVYAEDVETAEMNVLNKFPGYELVTTELVFMPGK